VSIAYTWEGLRQIKVLRNVGLTAVHYNLSLKGIASRTAPLPVLVASAFASLSVRSGGACPMAFVSGGQVNGRRMERELHSSLARTCYTDPRGVVMESSTESCDVSRRNILVIALASAFGLSACATPQPIDGGTTDNAAKDAAEKAAAKQAAEKAASEKAVADRAAATKQAMEKAAAAQRELESAHERHRLAMEDLERATARREALDKIVRIEATDVKTGDLDDLIRVIKKKGGAPLSTATVPSITNDLARAFVDYAWVAVDKGYPIPAAIVRRLPPRKAVFPALGLMFFTVGSVAFAIPVATFFMAALAAVVVSGSLLLVAVSALLQPDSPKKARVDVDPAFSRSESRDMRFDSAGRESMRLATAPARSG
jgi:hypothetical protein